MTDHELELQLQAALQRAAADFGRSIDQGVIGARLSTARGRRRRSFRSRWVLGAAAAVALLVGASIVALAPRSSVPFQGANGSGGPLPISVDPGWRLALDRSAALTPGADPIGLSFLLPADATRWALKFSCSGSSDLVVRSTTFVHTVPCTAAGGAMSRAVYRVENDQASGEIQLDLRTADAASFELIAETTASQLDDPLTVDPTPAPSDSFGYPGRPIPALMIPSGWTADPARLNGESDHTSGLANEPGVPLFRSGPVTIVLVCIGSGSLDIELTTITDANAPPPTTVPQRSEPVDCSAADGQITLQLRRPATGIENAVEVTSSSDDPNVPFAWSMALGQSAP